MVETSRGETPSTPCSILTTTSVNPFIDRHLNRQTISTEDVFMVPRSLELAVTDRSFAVPHLAVG